MRVPHGTSLLRTSVISVNKTREEKKAGQPKGKRPAPGVTRRQDAGAADFMNKRKIRNEVL